jgi:hypothetical protein
MAGRDRQDTCLGDQVAPEVLCSRITEWDTCERGDSTRWARTLEADLGSWLTRNRR